MFCDQFIFRPFDDFLTMISQFKNRDLIHIDSLHRDSVHRDSVHRDSIQRDSIQRDSIHGDHRFEMYIPRCNIDIINQQLNWGQFFIGL
jgi:hypothetical protein